MRIEIIGPGDRMEHGVITVLPLEDELFWIAPDPAHGDELRVHAKGRKTTLPLPKEDGVFAMSFPAEKP